MFTGLIREIGEVRELRRRGEGALLAVACTEVCKGADVGDSIAVDGACMTVEAVNPHGFDSFVSAESLLRTTLGKLRPGSLVHLEPSLKMGESIGGHFVQGHVDGVATVLHARKTGEGLTLVLTIPEELTAYIAPKGSIAVAGVSLTVAVLDGSRVEVAVVPHTLEKTLLDRLKPGDSANLESDLLARHLVAWLRKGSAGTVRATLEALEKQGY